MAFSLQRSFHVLQNAQTTIQVNGDLHHARTRAHTQSNIVTTNTSHMRVSCNNIHVIHVAAQTDTHLRDETNIDI